MSMSEQREFKPGDLVRAKNSERRDPPVFVVVHSGGLIGANDPSGERWTFTHGFIEHTTLTREDCEWLSAKGYRVRLKTTDVEELAGLARDAPSPHIGRLDSPLYADAISEFPSVPKLFCEGLGISAGDAWLPFECFTLDPGPAVAEPVKEEPDWEARCRKVEGQLAEAHKSISSASKRVFTAHEAVRAAATERDRLKEDNAALAREVERLRATWLDEKRRHSAALHEEGALRVELTRVRHERNKALTQLSEAAQPAYPSVLMQDRLTGEGPFVVVGVKDFGGAPMSLVYDGEQIQKPNEGQRRESFGVQARVATSCHWRWTASLEPYTPPPPPEPTPEQNGWDRATLARLSLHGSALGLAAASLLVGALLGLGVL